MNSIDGLSIIGIEWQLIVLRFRYETLGIRTVLVCANLKEAVRGYAFSGRVCLYLFVNEMPRENANYFSEGYRIAGNTSIELLLQSPFNLTVNNTSYRVEPPEAREWMCSDLNMQCPRVPLHVREGEWAACWFADLRREIFAEPKLSSDQAESLANIKILVNRLYENLTVSEHQLEQEKRILEKIEKLQFEMEPLEKLKDEVVRQSQRRTTILGWTGLGLMGVQFGVLARLTWWEYSWDIMEPVTYFVTYGNNSEQ